MINVYISDATEEFVSEVNLKVAEFLKFYITIQEDFDDEYRFEDAFPDFLYRTNKKRCEEVIRQLYEYTTDKYPRALSPLHEYALYQIIRYCEESYQVYEHEKEEGEISLFDIVSDEETEDKSDSNENGGYTLENFHTFDFYYHSIFQDLDFLDVDFYYKIFVDSPEFFYNFANMNIDEYVELMPPDIKNEFQKLKEIYIKKGIVREQEDSSENPSKKDLSHHAETLINEFRYNIEHRSAYKLLWNDDYSPRNEKVVQLLFLQQISDYCEKNDIDVTKESDIGRGPVDFKLSKGNGNRVLIEIKLASNNLVHGLEKQLVQYMISENVRSAVYLVICFTKEEYERVSRLSEIIDRLNSQYNCSISLEIIDATNAKKPASKLSRDHEFKYIKWN